MAPATNLGAATPVQIGGGPSSGRPVQDTPAGKDGGSEGAGGKSASEGTALEIELFIVIK